MNGGIEPEQRAGWWRRSLALMIDILCVAIPSAVVGAVLFAMTGGVLQWSNPFLQWQVCEQVDRIPAGLDLPPLENSDLAQVCRVASIAGTVGRELTVTRITKTDTTTTSVGRSYRLLNTDQPGGYDLNWLTFAALLLLLVGGEWRTGSTPGKRLLGARVVAAAAPDGRSVPLKRVAIRYGVAIGVFVLLLGAPFVVVLIAASHFDGPPPFLFVVLALAIVAAITWSLWNLVRIVRRRPTLYDAYAGVEVIRSMARPARPVTGTAAPGPA